MILSERGIGNSHTDFLVFLVIYRPELRFDFFGNPSGYTVASVRSCFAHKGVDSAALAVESHDDPVRNSPARCLEPTRTGEEKNFPAGRIRLRHSHQFRQMLELSLTAMSIV